MLSQILEIPEILFYLTDGREHIFVIEEEQEKYLCLGDLDIESIFDCRKKNLRKEIDILYFFWY